MYLGLLEIKHDLIIPVTKFVSKKNNVIKLLSEYNVSEVNGLG